MEKQLRIGEFIISLIILIGMGVAAWVNVKTEQTSNTVEMNNMKAYIRKVDDKQDEILKSISDLRVLIESKKNRDDANYNLNRTNNDKSRF